MRALVSLVSFVVVAVTVVIQLTIVDRIAFPGGAGPDLVLIAVAALALASGPMAGLLTGFWGGLALDVAPPGSHFVGENALVFCLIGYLCGLLADQPSGDGASEQGHTALFEILVTAAGAICGETLLALLGVMLSDPRFTWPAITRVLPVAVAYDVLLCPFVLYAAAAALRLAGSRGEGQRVAWSAAPTRTLTPGAGQGTVRQVSGANAPRLRLGDRAKSTGAGTRTIARREPQLHLGRASGRSPTAGLSAGAGTGHRAAFSGGGQVRVKFGGRRREGVLGGTGLAGSGLTGKGLAGKGLGGAGLAGSSHGMSRFSSSTMGRSLLGGSVFSRSSFGKPPSFGRSAPLGRSSPFRHRGSLTGLPAAGSAPRFSRGSSFGMLTGGLRHSAGPKSPGRGWLRGASGRNAFGRRRSPSGGGLRSGGLKSSGLKSSALRGSGLKSSGLGGSCLKSSGLGGSGLGGGRSISGRAFGKSRGRGSWTAARGSSVRTGRSGPARLRMPRRRAKRRWRTGGYR
ncbi:MAG: rod shape-determining protein MreD [Streptosporangiaceae bacterium]